MKLAKILTILVFVFLFSTSLFAQEMPEGFIYNKGGRLVFQVGPQEEFAVKVGAREGGFLALALAAGMVENRYYLTFYNVVPQDSDYIFEKQKNLPATLTVDGEKVTLGSERSVFKKKVGKTRVEVMLVAITLDDFEKLVAAGKILAEFGKINHLVSAENLQAFHYLSAKMEADEDLKPDTDPTGARGTAIHVKGYFRKDGTFVQSHTRRRPRN